MRSRGMCTVHYRWVRVMAFLLVVALFGMSGLGTVGCAKTPPAGTYSDPVLKQYNVTPVKQAILALSQSAIRANGLPSGSGHLSDGDTRLVRDFSLAANTGLSSYTDGNKGALAGVLAGWNTLKSSLSDDAKNVVLVGALNTIQTAIDALGVQ